MMMRLSKGWHVVDSPTKSRLFLHDARAPNSPNYNIPPRRLFWHVLYFLQSVGSHCAEHPPQPPHRALMRPALLTHRIAGLAQARIRAPFV